MDKIKVEFNTAPSAGRNNYMFVMVFWLHFQKQLTHFVKLKKRSQEGAKDNQNYILPCKKMFLILFFSSVLLNFDEWIDFLNGNSNTSGHFLTRNCLIGALNKTCIKCSSYLERVYGHIIIIRAYSLITNIPFHSILKCITKYRFYKYVKASC